MGTNSYKIKILVLLEQNPFVSSTAQNNRFLALAEGLMKRRCKLNFFFTGGYSSSTEKKKIGKKGEYQKFTYKYLSTNVKDGYLKRKLLDRLSNPAKVAKKVYNELTNETYDYLWLGVSQNLTLIAIYLLKKQPQIKILHERSEFSWISMNNKKIHEHYKHKLLPNVDVFAVMTKTLQKYYAKYLTTKSKIIHLPMTVDFGRFNNIEPTINLKKPYIGYCGTMNNKKDGVDILIQSFINIMHEFPHYLYLAGPQNPIADYLMQKEIIKKNNAGHRIKYLGSVSKEAIPNFLANAEVLAMARPNSKQAEGGFPTKLGEYLATGKPVAATTVGEIPDYLEDNESVFYAEPGNVQSFANALKRALTSENALKVGNFGKNVALKHFNKNIQAKRLYEVLIDLKSKI
ncbi:MAG: glycosyltransferase family 4 protein [bacterium]